MTHFKGNDLRGATAASSRVLHYDRDRPVHDMVREQASAMPEAIAVAFGARSMTYGELDRLSDALAARLHELGVRKGDVIGLFLPRSMETVIAQLATLKAGAAYLPIDPAYPTEHLDYMIGECEPKAVFVAGDNASKIAQVPSMKGAVIDLFAAIDELPRNRAFKSPPVSGGDVAYVMYTSGSTGRPKGVSVTHRGIARLVLDQNYVQLRREDVVLHAASISFDINTFEVWGSLLNGCLLRGMPDSVFSVPALCDVIREGGVTVALITTGLFNLFADFGGGDLPSLRQVMFGGEVASAGHARRFLKAHPDCALYNCYGPTEGACMATYFLIPPDYDEDELPIGLPIAHTGILILDENLAEVPPGMEGQIAISGDGLARGYIKRPDLTADRFPTIRTRDGGERVYLTGDIAMIGHDGMITFKGRRDRQVKINGKRIELDEIEAVLRRDHRLLDGVVACHENSPGMKRITAYLCPKKQSDLTDPEFPRLVISTLRTILPAYMIPSSAIVLKELPLTAAGKVDRSKLPAPVVVSAPAAVPQSRCEEIVLRLWRQALGAETVPMDRNFFDLGGTSLQLLRVHAGLEEELARGIDVFALFKHPTIRELVAFLEGRAGRDPRSLGMAGKPSDNTTVSRFGRSTL